LTELAGSKCATTRHHDTAPRPAAEDDADIKRVVLAAGAFAFIEKRTVATDLLPDLRAACGGESM